MKKNNEKRIAKVIWVSVCIPWILLWSGIVATIPCLGVHWVLPNIDFYTYLIIVGICMFIMTCIAAAVTYVAKVKFYHFLCKLEKVMKK